MFQNYFKLEAQGDHVCILDCKMDTTDLKFLYLIIRSVSAYRKIPLSSSDNNSYLYPIVM